MMIKKKDIAEFERLAQGLDDLVQRIKKYNPEVNLYVGSDNLYLMDGPTHNDEGHTIQKNVAADKHIRSLGGGDW